jgi:hypothetical protein
MGASSGFAAIKATKVVEVSLGLLKRELVLPRFVWRDAAGDFRGAKDDTISIRLPAYLSANKRALRTDEARVRSKAHQRKVDVTLTHDLQIDVEVTAEEQTLDIESLTRDIIAPQLEGIVRAYEDEIASLMANATYHANNQVEMTEAGQGAYNALIDAQFALNNANVPRSGRYAVVGSEIEAAILKSDNLVDAGKAGDNNALRDAVIGRLAGFDAVYGSNALAPDKGYAFHRTAYVLNTRAPFVPDGAPWGASMSRDGFAIRLLQFLDTSADINNVIAADAWVGTNVVTDVGAFDADGKWEPAVDPDESGAASHFVRSVEITLAS